MQNTCAGSARFLTVALVPCIGCLRALAALLDWIGSPSFAPQISFATSRSGLWRMVDKRRIDGIIADEHSGIYELRALGLSDRIKPTSVVVSTEAAETAFSKKSVDPRFVAAYAEALRVLVKDGSYQQIVQRYLAQ